MGAGASAAEVADGIDNVGAAYRGYASKARELGVNGELIAELLQDGGLDEALNDIGVSNSLQRRRLKLEASNQISGPSSGGGGGGAGSSSAGSEKNQVAVYYADGRNAGDGGGGATTAMVEALPVGQLSSQQQQAPTIIIHNQGIPGMAQQQARTFNSPMANRPPPSRHPAHMQQSPGGSRMVPTPRTQAAVPTGLQVSGRILLGLGWDPAENSSGALTDTQDEGHIDLDVGLVLFGQVCTLVVLIFPFLLASILSFETHHSHPFPFYFYQHFFPGKYLRRFRLL
jgi:hypothetical protein